MGLTNFPYGITSFGVPVLAGAPAFTTGNVFFVRSTTGSDQPSPYGDSPDKPFATIDYAIGKCTANNGDVIYVMPNHYESITTAAGINCDVSGISIIGIGTPSTPSDAAAGAGFVNAPVIAFDGTAATFAMAANGIRIQNLTFVASIAAVVTAVSFTAAAHGSKIIGCRFYEEGTNLNFLHCISLGSSTRASYSEIAYNDVVCMDSDNLGFINSSGTAAGLYIHHNVLRGNWDVGAIGGLTQGSATGVVTTCVFSDNLILNTNSDAATRSINFAATATGIVARNMLGVGAATDVIVPGDLAAFENYNELHTTDLSGLLDPATA